MFPILFSVGGVHIFSFSLLLVTAWCVFSFLFWRKLRAEATSEQHIFDLMFQSTLQAVVWARIGFVATHWYIFSNNFLKIVAFWVSPGLSFYSGLVAAMVTCIVMTRKAKIRVGLVLDAFALSLPWAILVGKFGSLLDGSEVGNPASIAWAVHYVGHVGSRHPVQAYEMVALIALGILMVFFEGRAMRDKWPFGLVGVWFILLFAPIEFGLEFFKEHEVYWHMLSANQWILVAFFAEALGAFYVRGGGREKLRPIVGTLYAKFSKRPTQ